MSDNVAYDIKFVSRSKETLERLVSIMKYEDQEYFLYRVVSVEDDDIEEEADSLFSVYVSGDVAWSVNDWFDRREELDNKTGNGAHFVTLDILAQRLDFGVEAFCEDGCIGFQEHHMCDHNGVSLDKCVDWKQTWTEGASEPLEEGGLEGYGDFADPLAIYDSMAGLLEGELSKRRD